jgi:hypothetical protein
MKPMPETLCAATREGSKTTWFWTMTSLKPYFETNMSRAAPTPTEATILLVLPTEFAEPASWNFPRSDLGETAVDG